MELYGESRAGEEMLPGTALLYDGTAAYYARRRYTEKSGSQTDDFPVKTQDVFHIMHKKFYDKH